ncbi:MAG: SH3 domain-containing protein [Desulfobacterales bacterium]|nr:SH3 domain-containing protein [Desulfobacterales bacterium]
MKKMMTAIIALTLLTGFYFRVFAADSSLLEKSLFKANQAYQEKRFKAAVKGYEDLLAKGHCNGHLYYNLGNAYLRSDDLGHAVLNFERARLFMPRDADLNYNLRFARDQVTDALPASGSFLEAMFFWLDDFNLVELFWFFVLPNTLLFAVLFIRLFHRAEWTFYLLLVFAVVWTITGTALVVKLNSLGHDNRAVVLNEEADVRSGPHGQDTVLFKLHQGAVVIHERLEDGWALIRLSDDKRGWLEAPAVERIQGPSW